MSDEIPESIIHTIRKTAGYGVSTGHDEHPIEAAYYRRCTHLHWQTGTVLMLTRDTGHHSSGWMKNPDFERCLHLSISFREPRPEVDTIRLADPHVLARFGATLISVPFDRPLALRWVKAILGDDRKLAWEEGAFSHQGRQLSVTHWRVFCDRAWQAIKPRGEVYSRELTEKGWKSWSDQHDQPNWVDAS
jgi:hypothetical protein